MMLAPVQTHMPDVCSGAHAPERESSEYAARRDAGICTRRRWPTMEVLMAARGFLRRELTHAARRVRVEQQHGLV
jgi:hypothetical protein